LSDDLTVRPIRDAVDAAAHRRYRREVRRRWVWFGVAAIATFAIDQGTKLLVRAGIEPGERIDLIAGVGLVRARNEGIAFGFFPGNRAVVATLTVVALAVIAGVLVRLSRQSLAVAFGGGLLVGGSIGNLLDRLIHGGVTDFIDPPAFPAFNMADTGITLGAVIIALGLLRAGGQE
jgi:signal peptidase II